MTSCVWHQNKMSIPDTVNNDFFTGQRGELTKFVINDTVLVKSGNHEGKECAVISVKEIKPEVIYLLENLDVTPDTALRLSRVLGMSADFRLGLQQDWDLWPT